MSATGAGYVRLSYRPGATLEELDFKSGSVPSDVTCMLIKIRTCSLLNRCGHRLCVSFVRLLGCLLIVFSEPSNAILTTGSIVSKTLSRTMNAAAGLTAPDIVTSATGDSRR